MEEKRAKKKQDDAVLFPLKGDDNQRRRDFYRHPAIDDCVKERKGWGDSLETRD